MGRAQAAYRALTCEEAGDYKKLKEAILYWMEVSTGFELERVKRRSGLGFCCSLRELAQWCLKPETQTLAEVIDTIVLEQFIGDLMGRTQEWVWRHQPQNSEETLKLVEIAIGLADQLPCLMILGCEWLELKTVFQQVLEEQETRVSGGRRKGRLRP